jgi:hypothetical protein
MSCMDAETDEKVFESFAMPLPRAQRLPAMSLPHSELAQIATLVVDGEAEGQFGKRARHYTELFSWKIGRR